MLTLVALLLAAPAAPIHLSDLLAEARARNPELRAALEQARAAASGLEVASALDDPMLMVQLWNLPVDLQTIPVMVQLSQNLPLGGKRAARRDVASAEAAATQAEARVKAQAIEAEVAKAYFDLYLADRTLEAEAEIAAALHSLLSAATARMAAGRGEEAEALRAQAELLKTRSEREAAVARRAGASARLLSLLDRESGAPLGPTAEPGLVELPTEAILRARGATERPELFAAAARAAQANARLRLAEADRVPDLNLSAGEMHSFRMQGVSDFLFIGLQGNLPLFGGKNRSKEAAAAALVAAARSTQRGLRDRIAAEVAAAYAEVFAERRQVELHHQLVPVSRQALASAEASYAAGRGSFLLVLDTERDLLMHELDLATHLAAYEQRLAELQWAVGGDLGLSRAAEAGRSQRHEVAQ